MRSSLPVALLLSAWAGCAHAPPGPDATAPHGSRGDARPVPLPHRIIDGKSGAELDAAALAARLRAARLIIVGESHPNPHHHAVELEVLQATFAADPSLGLGLEMLPRTAQPALDNFLAGQSDEATFLERVDWQHAWGYGFGFFRDALAFCRQHQLPVIALNAPRALVHAVAKQGTSGLSAEEKAQLPEMVAGPDEHREMVRDAYAQHGHGKFDPAAFERFYQAQLVWDETMAERATAALTGAAAPRRLVLFVGSGHAQRASIAQRAARRGIKETLIVLPVMEDELAEARQDDLADVYWALRPPPP